MPFHVSQLLFFQGRALPFPSWYVRGPQFCSFTDESLEKIFFKLQNLIPWTYPFSSIRFNSGLAVPLCAMLLRLLSLCCLAWLHFSVVLGEPDSDRVCAQNASEDCPDMGALMQVAADFQAESQPEPRKERTQDAEPPCQTGGMQLHDGAVVVAQCLIEGTPPLKAPILGFEEVMQEAKADADPYKNFCGDLEDSVCKMAYEVIDHGLDLAVGRWKHVALNHGSNGWGSSDMDICALQTSYVTAKIPSCRTLKKIGGCSACQECCKQKGERSSCYKALRPMLNRLLESYTHSVKYILSVSVRTVNFLKYMQRVALDYSVDSAYDQVGNSQNLGKDHN